MFKIDYDYVVAQQYAGTMAAKVDDIIRAVLCPGFHIDRTFSDGTLVHVVVEPHGFTKQFLQDYRKTTGLRTLLQGDTTYLRSVVERVRNDSPEHFIRLGKRKWTRCYPGRLQFEDFHTIMHYIFVENGCEVTNFVDKAKIVDDIGLKVCPYCGQSYIGSVCYPRNNGKMHIAKAQIDHFFPKGQYPFLALSYANFIPCCSTCNQTHKHIEDVMDNNGRMRIMSPYNFDETKFKFGFGLKQLGWIDDDNIEVKTLFKINTADDRALKEGYQHILGIDKLYEYHNDVVMDIIVRKVVELTAQRVFYQEGMKVDKAYIDRYITAIYGYEPDPKEDRRRVMSKFLRDVVKQVESMMGCYLSEKKTELQTKPAII